MAPGADWIAMPLRASRDGLVPAPLAAFICFSGASPWKMPCAPGHSPCDAHLLSRRSPRRDTGSARGSISNTSRRPPAFCAHMRPWRAMPGHQQPVLIRQPTSAFARVLHRGHAPSDQDKDDCVEALHTAVTSTTQASALQSAFGHGPEATPLAPSPFAIRHTHQHAGLLRFTSGIL
ncbi:hypothetical protein FB567DRAFT_551137 [Paraphoma chrysanthemicola]|uniref:Uncharacterized protein n=1 Tax=Paraphoma chrysanthemicola TaxID=798071 RepID=A0A8K0R399_9PLEO|nr:hypothetical protein FB567DRAFT_551137 [Paraphoma chrysanthemicola]